MTKVMNKSDLKAVENRPDFERWRGGSVLLVGIIRKG
jgi:hypothetical protein